jgi:hypothetical protein
MVDKDVTCVGLAIQRLNAWQHWARRGMIGCVGESGRRPGWKCRPEQLVEGIPVLGGGVALCSPRFARGFLPLLYCLGGLHGFVYV